MKRLRDITIKNKLLFSYFVILGIFVCLGIFFLYTTKAIFDTGRKIEIDESVGIAIVSSMKDTLEIVHSASTKISHSIFEQEELAKSLKNIDIGLEKFKVLLLEFSALPARGDSINDILKEIRQLYGKYALYIQERKGAYSSYNIEENVMSTQLKDYLILLNDEEIDRFSESLVNINNLVLATRISYFIAFLFITGISIIFSWRIGRAIVLPIRDLIIAQKKIGSGNLDYKVGSDALDEVGQLSRAFDKMVENLKNSVVSIENLNKEITERKQAEEALKEYTKKIGRINKELDDFTYIVSHDLKEPLRSIDAFSKFLEDDYRDKIDEEGKGYIKRIRANSLRMQNLIEDLLEISRIEKRMSHFEEVLAFDLLNEVKLRLEYAIKEKNVEITIQNNLPRIFCDRIRLVEVFVNLVSNAIKFNDKPNPKIEVGYAERGGHHEFYIKDNGPGIEEQYHEKIFEIFQRLERREDHEGTGAGLAIVKKIVQIHKGKIWVESKAGEGAAFYFAIPKKKEVILGKKKLGEILIEKKLITEDEVKKALEEQEGVG